ncbi:MAG: BatD family protein [Planctomycetes bacterium]|nr:BatD family protein [Planctomycetota bacterium]
MVPFFARAATCLSLLLSLFANATSAAAQDGNRMVTIEVVAPNEAWLGEVFEIEWVVRYDVDFFERFAVQFSRQRLDVPIRIDTPFFASLEGANRIEEADATPARDRSSIAIAGSRVFASASPDPQQTTGWRALRARVRYVATRSGRLELGASQVHYYWSPSFEEDFVGDRRPTDRRLASVPTGARTILVRDLPEDGKPASFTGAVGRFEIQTRLSAPAADGAREWTFEATGRGNFAAWNAPAIPSDGALHVRGRREERDASHYTAHFELIATPSAQPPETSRSIAVPSVECSWFDPESGTYVVHHTRATPFGKEGVTDENVAPQPPTTATSAGPDSDASAEAATSKAPFVPSLRAVDIEAGLRTDDPARHAAPTAMIAALFSPWIFAATSLLILMALRSRRRKASTASAIARRLLLEREAERVDRLFREYLRRVHPTLVASSTDDRRRALHAAGLSSDFAPEIATALEDTYRPRYAASANASPGVDSIAQIRSLVQRMESGRTSSETPRSRLASVGVAASCLVASMMTVATLVSTSCGARTSAERPPTSAEQDAIRDRLELAQDAWKRGAFVDAAGDFEALSRVLPGARRTLWNNVGQCEFAAGNYGTALLAFERASLRGVDPELERARVVCRERLGLSTDDDEERFTLVSLTGHLFGSTFGAAICAIVLQLFGFGLLLAAHGARRSLIAGAAVLGIGTSLAVVTSLAISHRQNVERAIVIVARAELRAAPSERAARLQTLLTGAEVRVLEASDRWAHIEANRTRGWIETRDIGSLLPDTP